MIKLCFNEMHQLFRLHTGQKTVSEFTPDTQTGQQFHEILLNGHPPTYCFAHILLNTDVFKTFVLGDSPASIVTMDGLVHIEANGQTLLIQVDNPSFPLQLHERHNNKILLLTNFESFYYAKVANDGTIATFFSVYTLEELIGEVVLSGSLWQSIFPVHHGIITRSIGYTFPKNMLEGTIFFDNLPIFSSSDSCEQRALDLLQIFNNPHTRLTSIDKMASIMKEQDVLIAPSKLFEEKQGRFKLDKYSPKRSNILDFGTPQEILRRSDWVTTYLDQNTCYHRDFFLYPDAWGRFEKDLIMLTFDILHTKAIRRTSLFRHDFTGRLYNILLPPALLNFRSDPQLFLVIFPCLQLNRTPSKGCFRNTLSMTYSIYIAKEQFDEHGNSKLVSAQLPLGDFYNLKDQLLSSHYLQNSSEDYLMFGPLKNYIELPFYVSIPQLMHAVTRSLFCHIFQNTIVKPKHKGIPSIDDILYTQSRISNLATVLLQVDWAVPEGYSQPWEKWISKEDEIFRKLLFKTISFRDFQTPQFGNTSLQAIDMKALNLGNVLGSDMTGMTLFNPREEMKIVLFPKSLERYPNISIVRWMSWHYYIDSAIGSLRVMIDKFHMILSERRHLNNIIHTLSNMVEEFVELYDLDLVNLFYRKEYEKLRNLLGIDSDYTQLISQLNSSKEDSSLREQRLINKLVFALTIATVAVSIISTIATNGAWNSYRYMLCTVALSVAIIWVGYILFDPVRSRLDIMISKIRKNGKY